MSMQNLNEVFWPASLRDKPFDKPSGKSSMTRVKRCSCVAQSVLYWDGASRHHAHLLLENTLSSAWASANKIFNATGVCLHAAITMPKLPPNSAQLGVSLEIFQSFIPAASSSTATPAAAGALHRAYWMRPPWRVSSDGTGSPLPAALSWGCRLAGGTF